ncbi:MAG: MerR family transcriptional regulator [Elusimicrobia bacterium]|nr:MerR family transcriptional regulator [Elusimicrobiota bacterium]
MIEIPPIPEKEFFSIGEVSRIVQIPAYVLRYWESEFHLLRPTRRSSGQRKYIRKDIESVFLIKDLLYTKKYTIAGAKKFLVGDKRKKEDTTQMHLPLSGNSVDSKVFREVREELEDILKQLKPLVRSTAVDKFGA